MQEKNINNLIEAYVSVYDCKKQLSEEVEIDEDAKYDRNRRRAAQRAEARNEARRRGQTGSVPGVGYVSPRPERSTYTDSAGVVRHHTGARMPKKEDQNESYDLFDCILEHLVAEGYADTNDAALAIMANMSEEWRQSIVEGMTMKDFKQQRSRQKQKEKRAAEKTSPLRRAGIHADKASPERAARHRANVDPDYDYGDEEQMYPGGKLKNPKKIRKAKALGELGEEYVDEDRIADIRSKKPKMRDKDGYPIEIGHGVIKNPQQHKRQVSLDTHSLERKVFHPKQENRHGARIERNIAATREEYDVDEAAKDQSNKQIEKGVKTTYKAGNVLDNQHQGRSRGLSRLPAGEREAKTKRMRERLKDRRNDLFKERGNREDEARAELKKRLGL
jgi:hypothetical protein